MSQTQIEVFEVRNMVSAREAVNKFLDENPVEYVDLKYQRVRGSKYSRKISVILIYKELPLAEEENGVTKLDDYEK